MITDDIEKGPLTFHGPVGIRSIIKAMCPFEWSGLYFTAYPQRPFKPSGLIIWDAPKGTEVTQSVIGNVPQLTVCYGGIPARFFAFGDSYEQIVAKLDKGLQPPSWGTWDTVRVGERITIELMLDGKPVGKPEGISIAMWGVSHK